MQIDWLTVAAQIVNFLVLVWLLKHFLYGPVTAAMARREERIADRLQAAREREDAADRERERLHERMERLEDRRDAILEQAREEAGTEKRRLLEEARTEVDEMRRRWRRQLRDEQDAFVRQLRRETTEGFAELARKALSELADARLEDRIVETLFARLTGLEEDDRRQLRDASDLTISTGFELGDERRERLRELIREDLGADKTLDFEQDRALICGIALTAEGRRLGWSLADYLDGFERRLAEHVDRGRPDDAVEAQPRSEAGTGNATEPEAERTPG
jgi:F-type H+-transporting ATPase subunit b